MLAERLQPGLSPKLPETFGMFGNVSEAIILRKNGHCNGFPRVFERFPFHATPSGAEMVKADFGVKFCTLALFGFIVPLVRARAQGSTRVLWRPILAHMGRLATSQVSRGVMYGIGRIAQLRASRCSSKTIRGRQGATFLVKKTRAYTAVRERELRGRHLQLQESLLGFKEYMIVAAGLKGRHG